MRADQVKTAKGRAGIAARMYKNYKSLGRTFDDCFEMGDGGEVVRHLIAMAIKDKDLEYAMRYTHSRYTGESWLKAIDLQDPSHAVKGPDLRPLVQQYPEMAPIVKAITENVARTINETPLHIERLTYAKKGLLEAVIQELQEAV